MMSKAKLIGLIIGNIRIVLNQLIIDGNPNLALDAYRIVIGMTTSIEIDIAQKHAVTKQAVSKQVAYWRKILGVPLAHKIKQKKNQ